MRDRVEQNEALVVSFETGGLLNESGACDLRHQSGDHVHEWTRTGQGGVHVIKGESGSKGLDPWPECRRASGLPASAPYDACPLVGGKVGERLGKRGLAYPGFACDQERSPSGGNGTPQRRGHLGELSITARDTRRGREVIARRNALEIQSPRLPPTEQGEDSRGPR